jgi:hypothetical protein
MERIGARPEEEAMEPEGERVVLAKKERSMLGLRWTGAEPSGMYSVEEAIELGAKWEGEELVTYQLDAMAELYEYYSSGEYLPDND